MDDKPLDNGEIAKQIDAVIDALEKRVDEAVALIKQHGLSNTRKRRASLSKLNWMAIRYLLIMEQWSATKIGKHFDISPKSILMRCKREFWRSDDESAVPSPELTTAEVNIAASMLGALGIYNLLSPKV